MRYESYSQWLIQYDEPIHHRQAHKLQFQSVMNDKYYCHFDSWEGTKFRKF